jgi:hypothetical protein
MRPMSSSSTPTSEPSSGPCGRDASSYANLKKVIHFLFSCNLSEILVIFAAILVGFPSPLAPLQVLSVNFVTDILPAMALVRNPAEPDVMRRPPRDLRRPLVTWWLGTRMLAEGACLAAGVLSAYAWVVLQEGQGPRAHTVAFVALVLVHPLQALDCRSAGERCGCCRRTGSSGSRSASWSPCSGAVSWPPLAGLLSGVPLAAGDWLAVAVAVVWPVALLEALKTRPAREPEKRGRGSSSTRSARRAAGAAGGARARVIPRWCREGRASSISFPTTWIAPLTPLQAASIAYTTRGVLIVRVLDEPNALGDVALVMARARCDEHGKLQEGTARAGRRLHRARDASCVTSSVRLRSSAAVIRRPGDGLEPGGLRQDEVPAATHH